MSSAPDTTKNAPEEISTEQAKSNLATAFREFDMLEPLRKHPFVVVGTAAAAGAVLGSSGKAIVGLTGLTSAALKLMKPLSGIIAQIAAAKLAAATAGDTAQTAAATEEPIAAGEL